MDGNNVGYFKQWGNLGPRAEYFMTSNFTEHTLELSLGKAGCKLDWVWHTPFPGSTDAVKLSDMSESSQMFFWEF